MFVTGLAKKHGSSQPMVRWLITWVRQSQASVPVLTLTMVPVMARGVTVIMVSWSCCLLFVVLFNIVHVNLCVCPCMCVCVCVCVCACVCVCVCICTDPVVMMFVPAVGCGFLSVCGVMWELFRGKCLSVVVIVAYFVAGIVLSLLINVFVCT